MQREAQWAQEAAAGTHAEMVTSWDSNKQNCAENWEINWRCDIWSALLFIPFLRKTKKSYKILINWGIDSNKKTSFEFDARNALLCDPWRGKSGTITWLCNEPYLYGTIFRKRDVTISYKSKYKRVYLNNLNVRKGENWTEEKGRGTE